MLLMGESAGTTSEWLRLGVNTAMTFTGILRSIRDENGKLALTPTCTRSEVASSLISEPTSNESNLASMPRFSSRRSRDITALIAFCPDHGASHATLIGHQPLPLSHATDLSETF